MSNVSLSIHVIWRPIARMMRKASGISSSLSHTYTDRTTTHVLFRSLFLSSLLTPPPPLLYVPISSSPNNSASLPRAAVSFQDLASLAKRQMSSPTRKPPPPPPPLPPEPPANGGDCDDQSGVPTNGDRESSSRWRKEGGGGSGNFMGGTEGGADTSGDESGVPNHVLVMQEQEKLGTVATMARGAFLFSLAGLCRMLAQNNLTW